MCSACAVAHSPLSARLANAPARGVAGEQTVQLIVPIAPAQERIILIVFPVIVEVEVELRTPARPDSVSSPAFFGGGEAGFGARADGIRHRRQARIDVVLRKGV